MTNGHQDDEYQIDPKYRQEDWRRIKRLREFYRHKFRAGDSDEAFLIWIETCLEELKEVVQKSTGG